MNQLVSVVMPAYNSSATIRESVNTVLGQSYSNLELIIVDDCSRDDTSAVLACLASTDDRIRVYSHKCNKGVAAARNTAIDHANGTYIAFLDSDDLWHTDKLRQQIDFMQRESVRFTYTDYTVFKDIEGIRQESGKRRMPASLSYNDLLQRGYTIGTLSVVLRRDLLGRQRFQKMGHEDFAMWLSLLRSSNDIARKVPSAESLASYRISLNSISSSKLRAARWMWAILSRQENLGFVKTLYGFSRYAVRAVSRAA
jgi:teichuronic acid biosynthesis glycosyltransferase TuaG